MEVQRHGKLLRRRKRQERALIRTQARDQKTPQAQLKELDNRLGVGVGAGRERTRLAALVEKQAELKANAAKLAEKQAEAKANKAKKRNR